MACGSMTHCFKILIFFSSLDITSCIFENIRWYWTFNKSSKSNFAVTGFVLSYKGKLHLVICMKISMFVITNYPNYIAFGLDLPNKSILSWSIPFISGSTLCVYVLDCNKLLKMITVLYTCQKWGMLPNSQYWACYPDTLSAQHILRSGTHKFYLYIHIYMIYDYIHVFQYDIIAYPCSCLNAEFSTWLSIYIPRKTLRIITY